MIATLYVMWILKYDVVEASTINLQTRIYPNPKFFKNYIARKYPNPKILSFYIPEATRTRIFQKSTYPKVPEPENFEFLYTRSYPNPKFKPAGTRRV